MMFGLDHSDFETLNNLVVSPLKKLGYRIYIFGSRATGKHHPFSDIDLLLDDSMAEENNKKIFSKIQEDIEEAVFPIKVDFVLKQNLRCF